MEKSNLKNIIVLKNLPSNIVDEAIVILKPNNKIKKIEIINNKKNLKQFNNVTNNNTHIINEAEMLVSEYISKIEKKETNINNDEKLRIKYNRLKKYSMLVSLISTMSIILHLL